MPNRSKRIILFSTIFFACGSYASYGDVYWDYHGSGRDHPYSYYIDERYSPGYADYPTFEPDYFDAKSYIIEQPTQINAAPAATQPDEFTVNVPNKHGGYTAVVIKRSGSGFTGPQGEYYTEFPKVFQLELMYGK